MEEMIAIVGRTNVGKSLLFNKLIQNKKSLVIDFHGVTRDINTGYLNKDNNSVLIHDTAGIQDKNNQLQMESFSKTSISIKDSAAVLFMVSASDGIVNEDYDICKTLRKLNKKIILIVNKIDLLKKNETASDFYKLGIDNIYFISAKSNIGIEDIKKKIFCLIKTTGKPSNNIYRKISVIGKPNSGKSTLINTLINSNRLITSDNAGTTIDSIEILFKYKKKNFILLDTAGIMKKSKTNTIVQKYSIVNTIKSINETEICLFIISSIDGITKQDKTILNLIIKSNKPFIIVANKIDALSKEQKKLLNKKLDYFKNITFNASIVLISAKKKKNIKNLLDNILHISDSLHKQYKPSNLTNILIEATNEHQPPVINNRRIKLKFAQQVKNNDLIIKIHGTKTDAISKSYEKYLKNFFINKLNLVGIPLKIIFAKQKNPFE
jgi:GTP-binding protein